VERFKEEHRDARGIRWLEELAQDTKYAARSLRRSPGFTLTAVSVLALGLGSSTAIFSAVDAVLVARLPYPDDDRLVGSTSRIPRKTSSVSPPSTSAPSRPNSARWNRWARCGSAVSR
jgi:hypothetical protein